MKKLIISAATMMLAFSFSFAGDNKVNKEAKTSTETKVEAPAEAKAMSTFYAVRIPGTDNFRWTNNVSELQGLTCKPLDGASCSIDADEQPEDNQNPEAPTHSAYQE